MEYDKNKYKNLNTPFERLFWLINPLFIINEFLGQRKPKIILEEIIPNTPFIERCYIPCPHCNTYHDSRIWSGKNSFMNWFGLYCPVCGKIIPCLTNATSYIFLAVTYPLWGWFKDKLKAIWLRKQPDRYRNPDILISQYSSPKKIQIKSTVLFILFMFIIQLIIKILKNGNTNGHEVFFFNT